MTTRKSSKTTQTITFDQWAESGGTAGIFAKGVRSGKIRIVHDEEAEKWLKKFSEDNR